MYDGDRHVVCRFLSAERLGAVRYAKMIEDGWVNDAFVTSSGMSKSDIQSMFSKGHLYPRQVQNEDRTARYDYHWMRVSDNVDQAVQESFADLG